MSGFRVLRWQVPADGAIHELTTPDLRIVHVDCRASDVVDLWILDETGAPTSTRRFMVTATGEHAPATAVHVGTALTPQTALFPRGYLVWHLWELHDRAGSGS